MHISNLFFVAATLFATTLCVNAETVRITSPSGNTFIEVTDSADMAYYRVVNDGHEVIAPSPLGLTTDIGDFTTGLSILKSSDPEHFEESYSLPNIKKSTVDVNANRQAIRFGKDGKKAFDVVFHVADNDVAYRYKIYPGKDTPVCVIRSEASGFRMPEGTTTFLCPQSKPMSGWARTAPSYETQYRLDAQPGDNGLGNGFSFPCLFKTENQGWVLISETGVDGGYCASHLEYDGGNLYTIAYPDPGEMNSIGSPHAAIALPDYTPWRTITFGKTLAPIAETTIPFDLVEPRYKATQPYQYGKGTWSWIIGQDDSCNYDEQKRYIDFAADMGYNSVLIDAWWDNNIGRDRIKLLADYAAGKGVGLYLWYNSNGFWNDAPQTPKNRMNRHAVRRAEMAWLKEIGIRGIKVDFFGGDKQEMMALYEDILSDANDFGIMVIFHGCTLPRGWERMYPNYVASEAVLASENLNFTQESNDREAIDATIHPLVRNTVGSMDFGGSALNRYYNAGNKPGGNRRVTSDVFALATAVLFQSPVQHFALAPNNIFDAPSWAVDFMKKVPTTWDEVRFIDGYPGRYLIMARRHGNRWYVAAINAESTPLRRSIALPDTSNGDTVTIYSDDDSLSGSVASRKVSKNGSIDINVPYNGAALILTNP